MSLPEGAPRRRATLGITASHRPCTPAGRVQAPRSPRGGQSGSRTAGLGAQQARPLKGRASQGHSKNPTGLFRNHHQALGASFSGTESPSGAGRAAAACPRRAQGPTGMPPGGTLCPVLVEAGRARTECRSSRRRGGGRGQEPTPGRVPRPSHRPPVSGSSVRGLLGVTSSQNSQDQRVSDGSSDSGFGGEGVERGDKGPELGSPG